MIRASAVSTGVDFHNSDIAYVGGFPVDLELMASLAPDPIVWPDWQDEVDLDQLEAIAPTVVYETDATLHEAQAFHAALLGRQDRLTANRARYDAQIAPLAALVEEATPTASCTAAAGRPATWERLHDADLAGLERARAALTEGRGTTYAKIQAWDGEFEVYAGRGGFTMVLQEVGFERVPFAEAMAERGVVRGEAVGPRASPSSRPITSSTPSAGVSACRSSTPSGNGGRWPRGWK